ncbi:MAG: ArsR/SmtB family transcription factor [Mycobacteriales bacterium]
MSLTNPFGDFELTDPKAMRALAHPVRLAILEQLQRHGRATATGLSAAVDASPSVASWHLRHLAGFGLVEEWDGGEDRRQRWWRATASGFRFEAPADDAEASAAARQLSRQMFSRCADLPARWLQHDEPRLEPGWRRLAGLSNTGVVVTAEELQSIEEGIERVLAPYVRRKSEEPPEYARGVRLMRYVLPEAPGEPE